MDLSALNQSVLRLIQNGTKIISFLKEFTVGSAKDVSITYINADGSESVKTFPNIAKQLSTFESWKSQIFGQTVITGTVTENGHKTIEFHCASAFVTIRSNGGHLIKTYLVHQHCCDSDFALIACVNTRNTSCEMIRSDENMYKTKFVLDLDTNTSEGYNDYTITITKIKDL